MELLKKKENAKQEKKEFGGKKVFFPTDLIFKDNVNKESIKQEKEHLG